MKALDFIEDLASILPDGKKLKFPWKIERNITFEWMTNKEIAYLKWFRTQQDDSDFDQLCDLIDRFFWGSEEEVDTYKIIRELFEIRNLQL